MTQRSALVAGSALAAALVCGMGLIAFFQWFGALRNLAGFSGQLFVLAIVPTVVAASISSAWVSISKRFGQRGHLANAVLVCLLAFPILFLVLWATIWIWLQFERHLPIYERPGSLIDMAGTAGNYTLLAFVVGLLPAVMIEYTVIRFVRKRWSSALATGVAP